MVTRFPASAAALLSALLLLAGGCRVDVTPGDIPQPYQVEIDEARAKANDFQFAVLEDGLITDAEFLETQDRYVSCMADRGIEVLGGGIGQSFSRVSNPNDILGVTAEFECDNATFGPIEPLFTAMRKNPENQDFLEIFVQCLIDQGVAPAGFTGRDYEALYEDLPEMDYSQLIEEEIVVDGLGSSTWFRSDAEFPASPTIPGGKSLDSPEALECYDNPLGLTF